MAPWSSGCVESDAGIDHGDGYPLAGGVAMGVDEPKLRRRVLAGGKRVIGLALIDLEPIDVIALGERDPPVPRQIVHRRIDAAPAVDAQPMDRGPGERELGRAEEGQTPLGRDPADRASRLRTGDLDQNLTVHMGPVRRGDDGRGATGRAVGARGVAGAA